MVEKVSLNEAEPKDRLNTFRLRKKAYQTVLELRFEIFDLPFLTTLMNKNWKVLSVTSLVAERNFIKNCSTTAICKSPLVVKISGNFT